MACLEEAFHPRQHHALAVAAEIARAQSGREHLAIHARQLALEPRLQILRRHPRPLLLACSGVNNPCPGACGRAGACRRGSRSWAQYESRTAESLSWSYSSNGACIVPEA